MQLTKRQLLTRARNKYPKRTVCISSEIWHYVGEKKPDLERFSIYIGSSKTEQGKSIFADSLTKLAQKAGLAPELCPK